MKRSVRVPATHALDERAYDVVVLLAPVPECPLPHRTLHVSDLDPLRARGCDFECVEHPPSVTAGEPQQVLAGLIGDVDPELLDAPVEQEAEILFRERPQPEHARAGE